MPRHPTLALVDTVRNSICDGYHRREYNRAQSNPGKGHHPLDVRENQPRLSRLSSLDSEVLLDLTRAYRHHLIQEIFYPDNMSANSQSTAMEVVQSEQQSIMAGQKKKPSTVMHNSSQSTKKSNHDRTPIRYGCKSLNSLKEFKFPTLMKRDPSNYNTAIVKVVPDESGNKKEEDPLDLLARMAEHAAFLKCYDTDQLQFTANDDLVISGLAPGMNQISISVFVTNTIQDSTRLSIVLQKNCQALWSLRIIKPEAMMTDLLSFMVFLNSFLFQRKVSMLDAKAPNSPKRLTNFLGEHLALFTTRQRMRNRSWTESISRFSVPGMKLLSLKQLFQISVKCVS